MGSGLRMVSAWKLLQCDGRLTIASAGKDDHTGRQRTQEYEVEGPVMMFLTTTAEQPDFDCVSWMLAPDKNVGLRPKPPNRQSARATYFPSVTLTDRNSPLCFLQRLDNLPPGRESVARIGGCPRLSPKRSSTSPIACHPLAYVTDRYWKRFTQLASVAWRW